jgi:dienelactone hydrolase
MNLARTAVFLIASAATAASGPWDLDRLRQAPRASWIEQTGPLRSLYYANEPFHGRPTRVFAYYAVPEKLAGKAPAMVLVHGGGGKAFSEWATLWAKRGYVAISMDLRGRGPDGNRHPDAGPEQGIREIFDNIKDGARETWPYHAVAAVIRAVSLLAAQPEVDPTRIGITGISWGGYLTSMVSGLDDRLKVAIPVYGCGFIYQNSPWAAAIDKLPERASWIENFDPSRYLAQARMPMLWVNGTNDFAYGMDNHQLSYRLAQGSRTLTVLVRMKHSHPDGWKPEEIGLFADQHLRGGVPLARLGGHRVKDGTVDVRSSGRVKIREAALCYTHDGGAWKDRLWQSEPAQVKGNHIRAKLPAKRPIAFFLTATDARGATVSTEHEAR